MQRTDFVNAKGIWWWTMHFCATSISCLVPTNSFGSAAPKLVFLIKHSCSSISPVSGISTLQPVKSGGLWCSLLLQPGFPWGGWIRISTSWESLACIFWWSFGRSVLRTFRNGLGKAVQVVWFPTTSNIFCFRWPSLTHFFWSIFCVFLRVMCFVGEGYYLSAFLPHQPSGIYR